jgi:uncharacterized protein with NRDE domain
VCTILVLHRVRADFPLALVANRDEFYARPTAPATRWESGIVAGIDQVAGGTWLGVSDRALFVAITNQRDETSPDPARLSRGAIVEQALRRGSMAEIDAFVAGLDGSAYNPFNLMWGDGRELRVAYGRRASPRCEVLDVSPGVHVLPSDVLDAPHLPKVRWLKEGAAALASVPLDELISGLGALAGGHRKPDEVVESARFDKELLRELGAPCVHTVAYGTRSSSIVVLAPGDVVRYLYADGPPCRTPYADVTPLLRS